MELTVADKFSPGIANEGKDYLLPEDQVVVEAEMRVANNDVRKLEYRQGPLYLSSIYDEFSRHYLTVNIARSAPSTIPLINTDLDYGNFIDDSLASSGILQYYHPGYPEWNSTFKKLPPDSRHLLSGKVFTDTNLVIKLKNVQMGQKAFEPLTGSMCVYVTIGEELHRITESMHFDATPENIRRQYYFAYTDVGEVVDSPKSVDVNLAGTSVNVADASGSQSHMCMFNITVPEELRGGDIFLVAQISKILSTDCDKAVAPYYPRAAAVEFDKHRASCMRLSKFRQPVAFGIAKINDCFKNSKSEVKCQMYAQKVCVNDAFVAQTVKELYQRDNNTPYNRMEPLDMEMIFTMYDLGRQVQMENSMKIQGLSVSMAAIDPAGTMKNVPNTGFLVPKIIPSQIVSDQSPFVYLKDVTNLEHLGKNSSKLVIRQALPLLPTIISKDITRLFKTSVDNTIFVYPLQLEKFQNRNLCLKIELIELKATSSVTTKTILSAPYVVLPNVYNHASIVGPLFTTEAYSRISYHVKNPVLTDEFKLRLPDMLTGRHWLRFTVLHMHVKPIAGRTSLLSNFVRSSVDKLEVDFIECGIGMLPLMVNGGECLLEDKEYTITMSMPGSDVPSAELPILRFRTKALSSLVSSDSKVQAAFRHHPQPLGSYPSSIMTVETATELLQQGNPNLSVTRLVTTTQDLAKASAQELSKHFLVVMRQLMRTLIAGPGIYDEMYCNPYKHTKARSQAFLTLLQVVGKIASDTNAASASSELSQEKEFLNAYVDFLFDEELPIRTSAALLPVVSPEAMLLLKGNGKDIGTNSFKSGRFNKKRPSGESYVSPRTVGDDVSVEEVKLEVPSAKGATSSEKAAPVVTPPSGRNLQDFADAPSNKADRRERPLSVGSLGSVASAVTASSASGSVDNLEAAGAAAAAAAASASNDGVASSSSTGMSSSTKGKFVSRSGVPPRKSNSPNSASGGKVPPIDLSRAAASLEWVSDVNPDESSTADETPRLDAGIASEDPAETSEAVDDGTDDLILTGSEYLPTSIDSTVEETFDAVRNSSDRKSWGKYITDAMWSSGKLQSLAVVAGGGEKHEVGEAYLDDIANHIILQAERIVIERLVSVAAMAMVSQVRYNSDNNVGGGTGRFKDVDEQSVLAGKRFRISKNLTSYQNLMPFEDEKTWFAALDSGETIDDSSISMKGSPNRSARNITSGGSGGGGGGGVGSFRKAIRSKESNVASIYIQPILPRYDTIDGYRERAAQHEHLMSVDETVGPNSDHWWPWMYEVIVYQWGAVLAIILSNSNLISSNNIESIVGSFPFDFDALKQMEGQRETRPLLMEHGPMLLRMMFKSLAMRIIREHKRPPVVLDDQFLNALENLVMLLAVESVSFKTGLWKSRKLVSSLANFLRSLFALVAPAQVVRLLRTFFRAVRKNKPDVEAGELRLQMIEEISLFDHIVAVNFPYTLDAPVDMFSFNIADALQAVKTIPSVTYSATGFRSTLTLPAYSLAHMIIGEMMSLYRQEEAKIKRAALEILRDLLVRHSCDARFADLDSQQRIVCMYLPLMKEILEDVDAFSNQRNDSVDRREMLAMLLYVVQNIPERILRHRIRTMCAPPASTPTPHTSPRVGSRKKTVSIVSMKNTPTAQGVSSSFIQKSALHQMPIYNLISALHLILDTFELPKATSSNNKTDVTPYANLLSPSVSVISRDVEDSSGNPSLPLSNRRVTIEGGNKDTPKAGMATSLLAKLDQQMQTRKSTTGARKVSTGGQSKGDTDRKWLEHAKQMAENSVKDRTTVVSKKTVINASKQLCYSATKCVMQVLSILFEECPLQLMATANKAEGNDTSDIFVLRDSNIDESVVTGIKDLRIIEFMKVALSVILHGLYCNQEDEAIIDLFTCGVSVIRQFGAKIFLVSVEDSLQDWMRAAFFHCASSADAVRDAGCNFILYLLQSCYHYLGSVTLISNTILAVINDVLLAVLDSQSANIQTHSDEDRALLGLDASIAEMKSVALQNYNQTCTEISGLSTVTATSTLAPFYFSVNKLMSDLEIVLRGSAELRRFLGHLYVGYDFLGANFLDGPFDDRCQVLMQQTRMQRKNIRPDSRSVSNVFQLEEVMMHIVQAAEVYDPIKLPRFRIQWLENLARLHELRGNRAEGAEIRWRIFQICQMVEDTWQLQWVPRPPLDWSRRGSSNPADGASDGQKADKKFFTVFLRAMDSRPSRAWSSFQQYLTHMVTSLVVATERFCNINLIHLAERCSSNLVQLYRLSKQNELLLAEYARISTAVKNMMDKGITNAMALGTFYRVFYDGQGVPPHLRGKEFIFRNANHLHVSEFQASVVSHLKSIVADVVEVKVVNDISSVEKNLNDSNTAYMVMNSVKLNTARSFKLSSRSAAGSNKRPVSFGNKLSVDHKATEAMNQVISFQYTVPFTKDPTRAHSKRIDEQWMRTTILTVKEPFPYILTRQLVYRREIRDFCPIEVSMNDIDERVEAMEAELEKVGKNASDNNNLMRIVQGSIMPQVNAGAAEVAKVFLSPHKILSDTIQAQLASEGAKLNSNSTADMHEEQRMKNLVVRLKSSLLDFLICSKLLLAKTRRVLITEPQEAASQMNDPTVQNKAQAVAAANRKAAEAAANNTTVVCTGPDPNNVIWQTEMEKGFENLVSSIWPYVQDIADADQFNNLK